jgi:hypothetical protein
MAEQSTTTQRRRITVDETLDEEMIERFLVVYRDTMAPMNATAAARQCLTDDEFREEMAHPAVRKYVGWNGEGRPVAVSWMCSDLSIVPWISPEFYAARFPEHYARDAIYYVGAAIVEPGSRVQGWAVALFKRMTRDVAADKGIAAFDCSHHSATELHVPELVALAGAKVCEFERNTIDTQTYYAYEATALLDDGPEATEATEPVVDLRDPEPVIDLRGATQT